jgi:hypothetical protein
VGSRVISPEQQDEEGVVLLVQFEVIAWADEKKQRRRRTVVAVVAGWAGLISTQNLGNGGCERKCEVIILFLRCRNFLDLNVSIESGGNNLYVTSSSM